MLAQLKDVHKSVSNYKHPSLILHVTCGATGVAYCSHVIILRWLGKGGEKKEKEERRKRGEKGEGG